MANKQCICPECGNVAEVRRQKNGQKLRFLHCKHGHGGLHTRSQAAKWEEIEQDHIGVFGELPPDAEQMEAKEPGTADVNAEQVAPAQPVNTEKTPKVSDWQPNPDETPEALEGGTEHQKSPNQDGNKTSDKPPADSDGLSTGTKIGLGILGLLGFGGSMVFLSRRKKG